MLEVEILPPYLYLMSQDMRSYTSDSMIISPFFVVDKKITTQGFSELCEYVQKHSKVPRQELKAISELYKRLIKDIDNLMSDDSAWLSRKKYDVEKIE
ncbi:hypothetical protein EHS15_18755 [Leptospira idonii]|uniref:Uncharacterized protein n=1 Tax=Leptospira idonii TaxID=1193500 RepID=A0A4R9LXD1_9LEPT|nr:hypothetical protein EHS15_18755 [Leptospira idonii]